ncbi:MULTISPECIES: DUF6622 family protein [unclassified Duganella]|uniref:DUF6622 family protein n=1 Tax=unclassified Duganella TaxID=2636909 RepID=UPI0027D96F01|nr:MULTISPECIES: DUF6622 family protein [unclassified Duganella]
MHTLCAAGLHFAPCRCISSHREPRRRRARHSGVTLTSHAERIMIAQIVSHTPTYVWALLAFLLYRGALASRDRELAMRALFVIPVVMIGLSLSSMNGHGALGSGVWAMWLLGVLPGVVVTWRLGSGVPIVVDRAAGTVRQRGSWLPLMLMIAIFCTKYAVAVTTAMHPELAQNPLFAATVTLLFGLFNGVFVGRLARYVAAWMAQPEPVVA